MLLRSLAYKVHPYRWSTIGMSPDHIARATIEDVRRFYDRYYQPSQAILSMSADMEEGRMIDLARRWFGSIPDRPQPPRSIPAEPQQTAERRLIVERDVPATNISIAFHMGDRLSRDFYLGDLSSDLLSGGDSSRLVVRLVKERRLFSSVNAYILGSLDAGLFIVKGQLMPSTSEEQAEEALRGEIGELMQGELSDYEMDKVKNKFEANALMGEINVMNKAMNLGYYAMTGDIDLVNREIELYRSVTRDEAAEFARRTFTRDNSSTLIYRARN